MTRWRYADYGRRRRRLQVAQVAQCLLWLMGSWNLHVCVMLIVALQGRLRVAGQSIAGVIKCLAILTVLSVVMREEGC